MQTRFPSFRTALLGLGAALSLSLSAWAQENASIEGGPAAIAMASAVAYGEIPAAVALDVVPDEDTELAGQAVEITLQALSAQGHGTSREAPYVVSVDAVLVRDVGQDTAAARAQEGSKRGDQYTNFDQSQAGEPLTRGNLFSSENSALLSPAQPRTGGHLLRVSYEVYSRQNGLYVWRGQIERDSLGVGPDASLQQMIPALLAHFGKTLAQTEVPLN